MFLHWFVDVQKEKKPRFYTLMVYYIGSRPSGNELPTLSVRSAIFAVRQSYRRSPSAIR